MQGNRAEIENEKKERDCPMRYCNVKSSAQFSNSEITDGYGLQCLQRYRVSRLSYFTQSSTNYWPEVIQLRVSVFASFSTAVNTVRMYFNELQTTSA
ncbi:hypothetical protein NDU88_001134 [Pleurodeles waltl]|uniref:Uncharacterized protein n=1 Tax=Pleurodeles waltl TaxID=8319 RepID=A0AAV7WLK8_PLEWA|nr:hypothetical protein NDU88_001134 [Pleurodeles waltl]